jgi:UDP-glucose 4-epimerase
MRALVTGGAGFIGSTLVDALVTRGDEVIVIDDLSTGRRENLAEALGAGAELREGDVRDEEAVGDAAAGCDAVFHLAAQIDARRAVTEPGFDASVNVVGTIAALEAARGAEARFVLASSAAVYGEPAEVPVPEDALSRPATPYGQSKLAAEGYAALYDRVRGLSTVSLRLSNVYGPRQDPLGEAGVVAIFCDRLRERAQPTVYGDGRQTRDFVHVDDVVAALLAAGESDAAGPHNVGTGVETSVLDLVEMLAELSPNGFEPRMEGAREGEVRRMAVDPGLAGRSLGWRAGTEMRPGLERTLAALG